MSFQNRSSLKKKAGIYTIFDSLEFFFNQKSLSWDDLGDCN